MTAAIARRRKLLFVTFAYPSSGGTGTQLRSAAVLRMLAARDEVHLLIAGYAEWSGGPPDPELESLCHQVVYLRIPPPPGERRPLLSTQAAAASVPAVDCPPEGSADWILRFYQTHGLDCLFVFRFDALHFILQRLEAFPARELDMDELPSRAQTELSRLAGATSGPRVAVMAVRVMEKRLLPKFDRVFVASAYEAQEVRRLTGYPSAEVLPNIYGRTVAPLDLPPGPRREILFVGWLGYLPNADAVVGFCREILPLIRAAKGDDVVFRVIGGGTLPKLESVRDLPGVAMMGYQAALTPFYARAALAVVPLRGGTGTRLKILEAFAHGRPVVSTTIGAQGLDVTDGEDILLADDPAAFARACVALMDDVPLAERLSRGAERLLGSQYSTEALARAYGCSPATIP
jgi:glycosyltransferase involved in cell wall biosynthesis